MNIGGVAGNGGGSWTTSIAESGQIIDWSRKLSLFMHIMSRVVCNYFRYALYTSKKKKRLNFFALNLLKLP